MSDIYDLHRKAFARTAAYVVVHKGERVATIALKYPQDGAGRLWAYVHWVGLEMVRGPPEAMAMTRPLQPSPRRRRAFPRPTRPPPPRPRRCPYTASTRRSTQPSPTRTAVTGKSGCAPLGSTCGKPSEIRRRTSCSTNA